MLFTLYDYIPMGFCHFRFGHKRQMIDSRFASDRFTSATFFNIEKFVRNFDKVRIDHQKG